MYKERTYRRWVEDKDLASFTVKTGESDLFIRAEKPLRQRAQDSLKYHRKIIEDYIRSNPEFGTALAPYSIKGEAPDIIREMAQAASSCGVGPMAAVAGAVAQYVAGDLLKHCSEVIVENGGDIFMKTNRARKIGIFAGESIYTGKLALEITPEGSWGICASSGTVGPSLSFGRADAAVVISHSAVLADAWATALANMVKAEADIEQALIAVKNKPEIKGAIIIVGDKIGAQGELKLVKS